MASGVIERPAEFGVVSEFLLSADRQPSGLVEGTAGIGKTTLWLAGVAEAQCPPLPKRAGGPQP